jgi:hypothetical protein
VNRLRTYDGAVRAGSVAGGFCIASVAAAPLPGPPAFVFGGKVVVAVIATAAVGLLIDRLLGSRSFPQRLFLGDQFVRGTWADVYTDGAGESSIGITRFNYEGDTVTWTGENFDVNGNLVGAFSAESRDVTWPRMSFICTTADPAAGAPMVESLTEIHFIADTRDHPSRYTGFSLIAADGRRATFVGTRVTSAADLRAIDGGVDQALLARLTAPLRPTP